MAARKTRTRRGRFRYHLGLGSNLGDRRRSLALARAALEAAGVRVVKASSIYETEPIGGPGRQPDYLNQALEVRTSLAPEELLDLAESIETALGRRPAARNAARPIDIDLLLAGKAVIRSRRLTVPHPRLASRRFVLVPLAEIAPRAVHPILRRTIRILLESRPDRSRVRRMGGR